MEEAKGSLEERMARVEGILSQMDKRLNHDYDEEGELVSLEILDASERIVAPQSIEFQLAKR